MSSPVGKKVCIIGAGLSGLVCGVRLSKAGFDVRIVEELTSPGGLLASVRIGNEYLELLPHHLRKTDKSLLNLAREEGIADRVEWFDSYWHGRASRKKVGYFVGGFAGLINILIQDITDNGGKISYSTTVSEITRQEDGKYITSCVLGDSCRIIIESDYVIFTGSCRTFVNVSHGLPLPLNVRDQMMNVTYKSSVSILMTLERTSSEVYFQKLPENMPFDRIVNHSYCFGTRSYGGNILYLVGDCSISDSLWIASDSDIMDHYFKAFRKLYPMIKKTDIKSWRLTKIRYAVSEKYPEQDLTEPLENLFVCASGLTKFGVRQTPENRMEGVVTLANDISARIVAGSAKKEQNEQAKDPSVVTPITVVNL